MLIEKALSAQRNLCTNAKSIAVDTNSSGMNTMKVLANKSVTGKSVVASILAGKAKAANLRKVKSIIGKTATKSVKAKTVAKAATKTVAPKGLSRLVKHTLGAAAVYCQPIGAREDKSATYPAGTVLLGKWGYSVAALTLRGVRCETAFPVGKLPKTNCIVSISHATRPLIWSAKHDGAEVAAIAKRQSDGTAATYMFIPPSEGRKIGKPNGCQAELRCGGTNDSTPLVSFVRWSSK